MSAVSHSCHSCHSCHLSGTHEAGVTDAACVPFSICLQTSPSDPTPESNTCDPTVLTYACVCGNGLSPNVSEYTQTLPYFICQEWGIQCVSNCGSDNTCASNCRTQHPCGAQHPVRVNSSTISTISATKTPSGTTSLPAGATTNSAGQTIYSGFGGAAASTSGSSAGNTVHIQVAALNAGQTFGVLGLIGALFGGFAILL